MADRPDTRPGLDLAIQAVTRRREEAANMSDSYERTGDASLAWAYGRMTHAYNIVLADLHALRQEAGAA